MSQASEDTVYVCCECVPESDLGVALHMMPCEKHGRGWHRIVKRSVQEPSPAALIVKGQRVQECDPVIGLSASRTQGSCSETTGGSAKSR